MLTVELDLSSTSTLFRVKRCVNLLFASSVKLKFCYLTSDYFVCIPKLTLASLIMAQAISSVRRISPVLRAPLAVKSKRRRSGATREPLWSASPKTPRRAKFKMCVAVWLLMIGLRRAWKENVDGYLSDKELYKTVRDVKSCVCSHLIYM